MIKTSLTILFALLWILGEVMNYSSIKLIETQHEEIDRLHGLLEAQQILIKLYEMERAESNDL